MIILYLDTSLDNLTVAILKDDKLLSKKCRKCKNEHSVYTVSYIKDVLEECNLKPIDVDKIMVVNGPGSFTGIRIGISVAKTYGYLLNKDIVLISSLKQMALSIKNQIAISLIDAKNDNYYMGIYDMFDNDVKCEKFATKEEVINQINLYGDAKIISNKSFKIDRFEVEKVELDIEKIVKYYIDESPCNVHEVLPNYLKLPQALEEKHD